MRANEIQKVACVGSGVIGTGWALCFAQKGYAVAVYDIGPAQLAAAQDTFAAHLRFFTEHGLVNEEDAASIAARVNYTDDLSASVSDAQFIQESGPENYAVKERILAGIESHCSSDAVIASSTSGLLITEMSKTMCHPGRLVGGHPYNPPHLIPLVELVRGEASRDEAVQCAYDFYLALGKEPVVLNKEVSGFISNRLQVALYREAVDLVLHGVCSVEDIDKAVVYGPGLRWGVMGPNLIFHLGAGEGGLVSMLEKQRESTNIRLSDMADWKTFPKEFIPLAGEGIDRAIEHRPAGTGHTTDELIRYRDTMLIELLRLHGKL